MHSVSVCEKITFLALPDKLANREQKSLLKFQAKRIVNHFALPPAHLEEEQTKYVFAVSACETEAMPGAANSPAARFQYNFLEKIPRLSCFLAYLQQSRWPLVVFRIVSTTSSFPQNLHGASLKFHSAPYTATEASPSLLNLSDTSSIITMD